MTDGFQMLGEIRPGPGWRPREDGKYQHRVPIADLVATNAEYVRRKVNTARVDEHSEKLLLELIAEKRLGRVLGPTRPPEWLRGVRATAVADHQDVDTVNEPPPGDTFFAASFPVCQTDENGELKVRRAEDRATTRRSRSQMCRHTTLWAASSTSHVGCRLRVAGCWCSATIC